jgi:hypothetical protein
MEPSPCTRSHRELSKDTKNMIWSIPVGGSHNYKIKQNNLPSFIDRWCRLCPWPKCYPGPQLIFPSKTWFFGISLNFQRQKSLKNQYLPHFESKSYQINSIKSCSSRSFQQHQKHIPIPPAFSAEILIWFSVKKSFNIQEFFCTASPNVMEPSPWTRPSRRELSIGTKQTNNLPS